MAEIRMEYIFIEKGKKDSESLRDLIEGIIDGVVLIKQKDIVKFSDDSENEYIQYQMIQKMNSDRCYLKLETKHLRINKAISHLQSIDDAILKSELQKYFYAIKEFDGISESYCNRLYPKYAKFERLLRQLTLKILTEAYGYKWDKETITEDMLKEIKEKAKGNVTLSNILENMDLCMLESFLFEKREVDYKKILETELSTEKLASMDKDDICSTINLMRPTSLWERNFRECGKDIDWENKIKAVHDVRNKVAHHKTIDGKEYKDTAKKLNVLNAELSKIIINIQDRNYTDYGIADILINFAFMMERIKESISSIIQPQVIEMISNFNQRVNEIIEPITNSYLKMNKSLLQIGQAFSDANESLSNSYVSENMSSVTLNLGRSFADASRRLELPGNEEIEDDIVE